MSDCCATEIKIEQTEEKIGKGKIIQLASGAVFFAIGLVLDFTLELDYRFMFSVFMLSYLLLGWNVLLRAIKNIGRGQVFDENFLMSIATIGAFIIGEFPEAAGVMLFYQVGELFQEMAVNRSKRSINALMDIKPDYANLLHNGETEKVSPESVNIGDMILVKPGEKIPLDGVVLEGESMLDTRALTGESVPRRAKIEDTILSGCINLNGLLTVKVTKTAGESTVAKIINLMQNASSKKAPTENFITSFSRYYTPVVVGLAALIAMIPPLLGLGDWADWVHRGLVFLVISCPCALVISIPLGFFGGIGGASKKGILVKGGNYLEALNKLGTVVFDKTGTLTKGVFEVSAIHNAESFSGDQLLEYAALAETYSNHPISVSIRKAYAESGAVNKEPDKLALSDYIETAGFGVSVRHKEKQILAGNIKHLNANGIYITEAIETKTGTKVHVAVDGSYTGCIVISDEVKPDSKSTLAALRARGIKTAMLTGDEPEIAAAIAQDLGLDEYYAGLLPHEKVEKVESLLEGKSKKGKLAFVGDGINDAPVLARSDVGIAMGAFGSDAAIEAADVVLMTDEPSKLLDAIEVARFTKKIVWQNIILALGIKAVFLALGAAGLASMWEAVFADVGVAVLAILNASRVIRLK